jgi:hypothetical protein
VLLLWGYKYNKLLQASRINKLLLEKKKENNFRSILIRKIN